MKIIECGGVWVGPGRPSLGPTRIYIAEGMIEDMEAAPEIHSDLFVIPAFVDAHCHFLWSGLQTVMLDLGEAGSAGEMLDMVSRESGTDGTGSILRGFGFDESTWSGGGLPSLEELDRASGDRPAILRRVCGHTALLNSSMMRLLPEDSPGLDRSTGIVREGINSDLGRMFPPEGKVLRQACRNAVRMAQAVGVTSVYTFENYMTSKVLRDSKPGMRISICLYGNEVLDDPRGSALKEASGLKFFLDGSIGASTAAISGKYSDGSEAFPLMSEAEVMEALELSDSLNVVPVFHAIGGRALSLLDRVSGAFLDERGGRCPHGIRVEHAEDLASCWPGSWDPEVHCFVMQPNFVNRWQMPGGLYEQKLGPETALSLNPFRQVMDADFRVAFGSDGMPFGPLLGLAGATGHPDPEQRLAVDAALYAYTLEAASVCGFREIAGSLRPDRVADLAVLSGNPFTTHWEELEVVGTLYKGRVVFEKERVLQEI
ncbi:MAG: amidohydrolase family protein [Candidatus Fermentibacteraceae bacterium]|nr:amidohydrolase family protein [Candidatus Fermentibacteraceae bacterium]MBN2609874.1 amidohydrolase family protein [Candidatus Fermentibacteraceae bacterium]